MDFFPVFFEAVGPQVATLLFAIAANVILGVAVAIKRKRFAWVDLANFYFSDVIPKFLGYVAVAILAHGSAEFLPEPIGAALANGLVPLAWLTAIGSIVADIVEKLAAVGVPVRKIPGIDGYYGQE